MESLINQYTKKELEQIIKNSYSYAEVIKKLGYATSHGKNIDLLKKYVEIYHIDCSHFTNRKRQDTSDEKVFIQNSEVSQNCLRRRYKKKNYTEYKCAICGQEAFWNGKPLTLTLDHINGKNHDNRVENLRWVCPNCDRQLDTYGGKNLKNCIKNKKDVNEILKEDNNPPISKKEKYIPTREELKKQLYINKNFTQTGNYFQVSSTQIRKWCELYNLPKTINIIKHTSEKGWESENWNDCPFIRKNGFEDKKKQCLMIDKNTNQVLKEFDSIYQAACFINKDKPDYISQHISQVCHGKRNTAYGYKWSFKKYF